MTISGSRPIRVLVIGRFTSIHTRRFAEELQRQGVVVAAMCFSNSKERPNVQCYQPKRNMRLWGIPRTATLGIILYLRSAIREFHPDFVHIHDYPSMAGWFRFASSSITRLAYTNWGHYPEEILSNKTFRRGMADALLITSDANDVVEEIAPFAPRARREIIRFGADMELFSPGEPDPVILAKYGLSPGGRYVLSPRSIRPNYNQITLIRALPTVVAEFPDLKVILKHHHVENYSDSADYERCLREEAESLGVWKHVIRLNHLPYQELCHLYRISRVAVSIPLEDGFPATIFEAMAAGCPLVVSGDGSYAGVIESGKNSIAIKAESVTELSSALLSILRDRKFAQELHANGLKTVREKGDFTREMSRLVKAYGEILNEPTL